MNKFDEAINIVKSFEEDFDLENWLPTDKAREIINGLRKEYAPKIEMTKGQKDNLIFMQQEGYSFVETIADVDSGVLINTFDSYWKPLTQEQLMQAWQHPNDIIVKGE